MTAGGGQTYQVHVRFTPTSGDAFVAVLYELHAVEVLGDWEFAAAALPHSGHRSGLARRS